jgi:hypothetical protein
MKTRLGTIIVTILAILGGLASFIGTSGYFGLIGASEGFTAACHTLRIAEARQLITNDQRAEIAKLSLPAGKGDAQLAAYFASDCSRPFYK